MPMVQFAALSASIKVVFSQDPVAVLFLLLLLLIAPSSSADTNALEQEDHVE
jgi:hypothetical protein